MRVAPRSGRPQAAAGGRVVEAVFAVLAGHGLIRDAGAINYPGTIGPSIWRIAALGRRCLFLLDIDREELG
jgi:hypothetical protein